MKIRYIGWLKKRPRSEGPLPFSTKPANKSSWDDVLARFGWRDPNKPQQDDANDLRDRKPKSKTA